MQMESNIPILMATATLQLEVPIKIDIAVSKRWSNCD
jgi:DNA polymerase I-like protein with 3'-5' exonuclease and polymerase domains